MALPVDTQNERQHRTGYFKFICALPVPVKRLVFFYLLIRRQKEAGFGVQHEHEHGRKF